MDTPPSPSCIQLMAELPTAAPNKYEIIEKIAHGGYGEILKVVMRENRDFGFFALKRSRHEALRASMTNIDYNEIRALKLLEDEDNFVKMIEVVREKDEFGIVLELCRADLRKILHNKNIKFDVSHIKNMLKQYFTGVTAMHRRRMMHRDLKPANILISINGIIKIGDLGSSVVIAHQSYFDTNICTMWYKCPELLFGFTKYDEKIDVWSSGLVAAEFFMRQPALFKGRNHFDQMEKISAVCGFCNDEIWPGAKEFPNYKEFYKKLAKYKENTLESLLARFTDYPSALSFIVRLLQLVPGDRMTADEALEHEFLTSGHEPAIDLYPILEQLK